MKTDIFKRPGCDGAPRRFSKWCLAVGFGVAMLAACGARGQSLASVQTVSGGPGAGYLDGDTFNLALFNTPLGMAYGSDPQAGDVLFVADRDNNAIRKLDLALNETITFLTSRINKPVGVALDSGGNLIVLNRGTGSNGTVLTFNRFGNFIGTNAASLVNANGMALDGSANIYVTVNSNTVIRISPTTFPGTMTTVATVTEPGTSLQGITVLSSGYLAVCDGGRHGVLVINPSTGIYTNLSGFNGAGDTFGIAGFAQFNKPYGIAAGVGAGGDWLIVTDQGNHRVKTVDPSGTVCVLYGVCSSSWVTGSGTYPGWWDGSGCPCQITCQTCNNYAESRVPAGVTIAPGGSVYTTENYYHLIRQTVGAPVAGPAVGGTGGTGGTNVVVFPPAISPNSGYFPMGQTIVVTSPNPDVFYTMNGTDPTTNSLRVPMNGNVGIIRWINATNDLTALRVRAFVGTNASVVVSGVPVTSNSVGVASGPEGALLAGVGSTIVVPVVANLRTNDQIRSFQFRVEVSPNNGAPPIPAQFTALDITPTNDFIPLVTAAQGSVAGIFSLQPYSIGDIRGLVITAIGTNANVVFQRLAVVALLAVPIPVNAVPGQTYTIAVNNSSATSDGAQTPVPFPPMAPATILVTNVAYTVGDSAPGAWYNAGGFGNDDLDNADVNNTFYASSGLRLPFPFTDVYDAMDAYPLDTAGVPGGDGEIRFLDWQVTLQRSLRLPPYTDGTNNWRRAWSVGGFRTAIGPVTIPFVPPPPPPPPPPGSVWDRQALVAALPAGNAVAGALVNVPVYVKLANAASLSGLQFRVLVTPATPGAPELTQTPVFIHATASAPVQAAFKAGELACGWSLGTVNFAPRSSNYLGTVRFTVPAGAQAGHTYTVAFANADGSPDLQTQYAFETKRASVSVGAAAAPVTDPTSDEWKLHFFGSLTAPNAGPNVDADGDGLTNDQEYRAGTHPLDAGSRLRFSGSTTRVLGGQRQVVLQWLSAPGKAYEVLGSSSLGGGWSALGTVSGDGTEVEFAETNPAGGGRFYRLRVLP